MTKEKANIDKVYTNPTVATKPTLLKFQNGCLAAVNQSTKLFTRVKYENKRKGAMVVSGNSIYHGLFNEATNEELTDSYICVRNRKTNKVRIIPIEEVTLNNHIYNVLDKTRQLRMSNEASQTTLLKQFGGRKAARHVVNAEKMKINVDVLKNELDTTINEISITEEDESVNSEDYLNSLRPKYHAEAIHVHEIYNVSDVVPQHLLNRLEEEARVVLSTNINDIPISSEYLKEKIKKIQSETPSVEGTLHIKLFIYMDALANLLKSPKRKISDIELSGITEKVETDIRERFSDPNTKNKLRTKMSTEMALCHYIILALLTSENYSININTLAQEIGMAKARITKFATVSFARKKPGSEILSLTLPSKVPKMRARASRKPKQ